MNGKTQNRRGIKIGVISDTHGLLRREAVEALQGSDLIIHAGDIGGLQILDELKTIAPVVAVRGNMDNEGWSCSLQRTEMVKVEDFFIYVLHDISRLDLEPGASGIKAVISGHSHRPSVQEYKGVLYVNPGSAGPLRFRLPASVARLSVMGESVSADLITLKGQQFGFRL